MGKQRRRRYRQPRAYDSAATIRLDDTRWSEVRDFRLCQQRSVQRRDTSCLRYPPQASEHSINDYDHITLSRLTTLMFAHDTQASSSFLASALRIEVDGCARHHLPPGEASPARWRRCAGPEKSSWCYSSADDFGLARRTA